MFSKAAQSSATPEDVLGSTGEIFTWSGDPISVFVIRGNAPQALLDFQHARLSIGRPGRPQGPAKFDGPNAFHVVAVAMRGRRQSIIGCASATVRNRSDDGAFQAPYVYIHSVSARYSGLGEPLTKIAIATGIKNGARSAELDTRLDERPLRMYVEMGFELSQRQSDTKVLPDGHVVHRMRMPPAVMEVVVKEAFAWGTSSIVDRLAPPELFDNGQEAFVIHPPELMTFAPDLGESLKVPVPHVLV